MRDYAYCARYGHLSVAEMRAMTLGDLARFKFELCEIIRAENGDRDDGED